MLREEGDHLPIGGPTAVPVAQFRRAHQLANLPRLHFHDMDVKAVEIVEGTECVDDQTAVGRRLVILAVAIRIAGQFARPMAGTICEQQPDTVLLFHTDNEAAIGHPYRIRS